MLLLFACAPPLADAAAQTPVYRVETIAGEPWLVGTTPAESPGPWTGQHLAQMVTAWVGPTASTDARLAPDSRWRVGTSSCTVDRVGAVTAGYLDLDATAPVDPEPQCGQPRLWAHLRCDRAPDALFAVPEGATAPVVATTQGPVERPDIAALVQRAPAWKSHRAAIQKEAAAQPVPVDGPALPPEAEQVSETLTVTRWAAGDSAWLVVDGQISWGEGYVPCGGRGGMARTLVIVTDTPKPRVVTQVWRADMAQVLDLLLIDKAPTLRMALDGSEYLGAEAKSLLYEAQVCLCAC